VAAQPWGGSTFRGTTLEIPQNPLDLDQMMLLLPMMLLLVKATHGRVESVGWAFAQHGGFPPTPSSWGFSGVVRDWTVAYFMGNASGPNNAAAVAAQSRFGIAGIGWQINNKLGNYSHEEMYEAAAAQQIRALRPEAKVMVTRDTQVVTYFWDSAREAMRDHPEYFLLDASGAPISRPWVRCSVSNPVHRTLPCGASCSG
jgi:hypothetical protein